LTYFRIGLPGDLNARWLSSAQYRCQESKPDTCRATDPNGSNRIAEIQANQRWSDAKQHGDVPHEAASRFVIRKRQRAGAEYHKVFQHEPI